MGEIIVIFIAIIAIQIYASFELYNDVVKGKGYENETKYLWWCILVFPIGVLMVIALPDKKIAKNQERIIAILENGNTGNGRERTDKGTILEEKYKTAYRLLENSAFNEANMIADEILNKDAYNPEAFLIKLLSEFSAKTIDGIKDDFSESSNYKCLSKYGSKELLQKINNRLDEVLYGKGIKLLESAKNEVDIEKAKIYFDKIPEYKNSSSMSLKCTEAYKAIIYDNAIKNMSDETNREKLESAVKQLSKISGYKNTDELKKKCLYNLENIKKDSILAGAKSKMVGENESDYQEAIEMLNKVSGWKDANENIEICNNKIEEIREKREFERKEAQRKAKRRKKITTLTTIVICMAIVVAILLNIFVMPSVRYNKAITMMENGNVVDAYEAFVELDGYKDSTEKANYLYENYANVKISSLKYNNNIEYVKFGNYEQDGDVSNGNEEIEWMVLEIKNDKALLISKYAIDRMQYNTSYEFVTWDTCTLRQWLNNEFLNAAFSDSEKTVISTERQNGDKVFLLTEEEVTNYLSTNELRQCEATNYAISKGAYMSSDNICKWWLQFDENSNLTHCVAVNGGINRRIGVNHDDVAVRPVIWLDLNSID